MVTESLTTTWTTVSSTQTDVSVVTATVSSTSVVLATVTTTVRSTSTNVPTGTRFRLTTQAGSGPGGLIYFGVENYNDSYIKRRGAPGSSNSDQQKTTWEMAADRTLSNIWNRNGMISSYDVGLFGIVLDTARIFMRDEIQGTNAVNSGSARRVFACVDRVTNNFHMYDDDGRSNLVLCTSNLVVFRTLDGGLRCSAVTVTAQLL
ncbi:hypothetical protein MN608_06620 [Microdochium nivale]|nr:hypothetical protein MN608_06620 [Microdochium nivale]